MPGLLLKGGLVGAAGAAGYGLGTLADRAFGISDWVSDKAARLFTPGYAEGRDQGQEGPREVSLAAKDAKAMGDAVATALPSQVLKVQIVPSATAPSGEESEG